MTLSSIRLKSSIAATYKLAWQCFATVSYLTQLRFVTEVRLLRDCGGKIKSK